MSPEWRGRRALKVCGSALLMVLLLSCNRERPARQQVRREPAVQATVVTIRTTIQPANKTFVHSLVIGSDRARSGDEVDRWRLFDWKNSRVTFVDDIAKTVRTETIVALTENLRQSTARELPPGFPRIAVVTTGTGKVILESQAAQIVLRSGTYVRELWIAEHPAIPPGLFAMMIASTPSASPLSGMMKSADEALLATTGFPLVDHAEIAYGDKKLSIDRDVVKIERRAVPQSWLNVPRSYRDLTPAPVPQNQKPAAPAKGTTTAQTGT